MCGIVGVYYFDRMRKVEAADLKMMMDMIVHRGPDDEGLFVKENVGLGMRRLSIIDLSGGHQPIFNEDKSKVIVFNGEVYNFIDHRDNLVKKGHSIKSRTDTEVILHLYEEYGLDFFEKLNGMFGLSIWDDRQQQLLIARDRIGIKPLYYYKDEEKIVFASEIKAILAYPGIKAELDYEGLSLLFKHGFTPAPHTLFQNIQKIPPAHFLLIRDSQIELKQYWKLKYSEKFHENEQKLAEELYELLKDSVRYRLISDVPLGAFLSGGMDSSGIVHIMDELEVNTINTYSIGFGKGYEFYNELDTAGRFAREKQTNHHEILVEPNVAELFPKLIWYLDEPLADSSFVVTYLVSQLARETVTVILSGVGGDELFGGYRRYMNVQLNKYVRIIPAWMRQKILLRLIKHFPVDRNNAFLNFIRLARGYLNTSHLLLDQQYSQYTAIFNERLISGLLQNHQDMPDFYGDYFDECDSEDILDVLMYFDLKTSLPEQLLMLTDKMTMANSLEARVPFLDHRLVEFAAKIPTKYKIDGFKLRHIQKKAFEDKFPSYILKKKKKGFGAPVGTWIRNELKEMVQDLLSPERLSNQGIFNSQYIEKILEDHYQLREDYTDSILLLITFQLWYDKYINHKQSVPKSIV
ncbi:MAG: asparagine synthase (glutamine-hydrolyzing) [Calditrichaeota bacterium]|nr:MAG: asparagine synthase (glutamine-hydrolyzing) [Calditrichota bacterium]